MHKVFCKPLVAGARVPGSQRAIKADGEMLDRSAALLRMERHGLVKLSKPAKDTPRPKAPKKESER